MLEINSSNYKIESGLAANEENFTFILLMRHILIDEIGQQWNIYTFGLYLCIWASLAK